MKMEKIIKCQCNSEGIVLENDPDDGDIYMAMWNLGQKIKPSLWIRITYAWEYLKTGKFHNDQMVLNADTARELGDALYEAADRSLINSKVFSTKNL